MKRVVAFLLVLCIALSLSGCGVSQSEYNELLEENSSLQAQVESLEEEVESLQSESDIPLDPDSEDFFSEVEKKAKDSVDNSFEITEGELYDSISSVYSDISLLDINGGISISIFIQHKTEIDDSTEFFAIINKIMETCKLENYYSDVSFVMRVDDSIITMLNLTDYTSSSSFSTTGPFILNDAYKESIETLYSIAFSSNDVLNNLDKELDALMEKYK